jgi:hypothetical protein
LWFRAGVSVKHYVITADEKKDNDLEFDSLIEPCFSSDQRWAGTWASK